MVVFLSPSLSFVDLSTWLTFFQLFRKCSKSLMTRYAPILRFVYYQSINLFMVFRITFSVYIIFHCNWWLLNCIVLNVMNYFLQQPEIIILRLSMVKCEQVETMYIKHTEMGQVYLKYTFSSKLNSLYQHLSFVFELFSN